MRSALTIAALVAASTVAIPAQAAVVVGLIPSQGLLTITTSTATTCLQQVFPCSTVDVPFERSLPEVYIDVPILSGTYNFSQFIGVTSNAGTFSVDGSFTLQSGSLLSSLYNFRYSQASFNGSFIPAGQVVYIEATASGFVVNAPLNVLGRVLSV